MNSRNASDMVKRHRFKGIKVTPFLTGLLLGALAAQACARPSPAVFDACLRTESTAPQVRYTPINNKVVDVTEDEEAGKTDVTFQHGPDTIGTWEVKKPQAFGLVFNGKETPLGRVTSLDRRHAPSTFNPYLAIWGEAREGKKSYICATFNFDGLGRSGSFQNIRGLYLIERRGRSTAIFYAAGNIASREKQY